MGSDEEEIGPYVQCRDARMGLCGHNTIVVLFVARCTKSQ